nr:N-acetyltransferase [Streptomyces globisporus]
MLTGSPIADAREAGIDVLTLDTRGDNAGALHPYRSLGFTEYGRLPDFVTVGERRHDKVFSMPTSAGAWASTRTPRSSGRGRPTPPARTAAASSCPRAPTGTTANRPSPPTEDAYGTRAT